MSTGARVAVVALAIALAAGAFVVLSGQDDKSPATAPATPTKAGQAIEGADKAKKPKPEPEPKPEVAVIVVKGGQPAGGVQKLSFEAGAEIRFVVESDQAAEVHFHGYDIAKQVEAGGKVEFGVPADIEGVFEVELEETATPIAEISVEP